MYFATWIWGRWLTSGERPHAGVAGLALTRVVNSASGTKHPRKLPSKSLAIQNRRLFAVGERLVLQNPGLAETNRNQMNRQALFPADRAGFSLHTCPQKSYHSPARDVNFRLLLAGQVLNAATRNLSPNTTPSTPTLLPPRGEGSIRFPSPEAGRGARGEGKHTPPPQPQPFSHPREKGAPASPLPKLEEGQGVRASKPPSFEKPCTPRQSPSKKPMGTGSKSNPIHPETWKGTECELRFPIQLVAVGSGEVFKGTSCSFGIPLPVSMRSQERAQSTVITTTRHIIMAVSTANSAPPFFNPSAVR